MPFFVFIKKLLSTTFDFLKNAQLLPKGRVEWTTENALNMHPIKSFISKNEVILNKRLKSLIKNDFPTNQPQPLNQRRPQKVRKPHTLAKLFFTIITLLFFKRTTPSTTMA
jgi:hypothetical protein